MRVLVWLREQRVGERLVERFGTFETIQGAYLMALGVALLWKPQLMLSVGGVLLVIEGLRRLVVNRVKEQVKLERRAVARKEREHERQERAWRKANGLLVWLVVMLAVPAMTAAPVQAQACTTSSVGMALIQHFEGYVPVCYADAVGKTTIGFGHLVQPSERDELCSGALTPQAGYALLRADVAAHEAELNALVAVPLAWHECDALSSWTFNLGGVALRRSTMLARVNDGETAAVVVEMRRWVYAGGRRLRGLVLRREAEARLYSLGFWRKGTREHTVRVRGNQEVNGDGDD